jgi:hypothetical protein
MKNYIVRPIVDRYGWTIGFNVWNRAKGAFLVRCAGGLYPAQQLAKRLNRMERQP